MDWYFSKRLKPPTSICMHVCNAMECNLSVYGLQYGHFYHHTQILWLVIEAIAWFVVEISTQLNGWWTSQKRYRKTNPALDFTSNTERHLWSSLQSSLFHRRKPNSGVIAGALRRTSTFSFSISKRISPQKVAQEKETPCHHEHCFQRSLPKRHPNLFGLVPVWFCSQMAVKLL